MSWASRAARNIRQTITANSPSTTAPPTNPSSSPTTVKMKSVCCSGTYAPFVCEPPNSPWPVSPPLPIAIWDCSWL